MGLLERRNVSGGWRPDLDASAAIEGAFLRADNLVLDERGVLAIRRGLTRLQLFNGGDADIHTIHTEILNGIRNRIVGADDTIYLNGGVLVSDVTGSGDVAVGASLGQILMARGSTRKKFNGTTLHAWGVAMSGGVPQVSPGAPDGKTFVRGTAAGVPAFVSNEDSGAGLSYVADHGGVAFSATAIHPSATTGRATMTATFPAPSDFTVYDNATDADDNDILSFFAYATDPASVSGIDLLIDVNDGSFQGDYYLFSFAAAQTTPVAPTDAQSTLFDTSFASPADVSPATPGGTVAVLLNVGWNKLQVTRGQMQRVGATSSLDWSTVKAVRIAIKAYTTDPVYIDSIRIAGGRLSGALEWCYIYVNDTGTYVGKSAPSTISDPVVITSGGANVLIPSDVTRDPQATAIWLFRRGGLLPDFLRVATSTFVEAAAAPAVFSYSQIWESEPLAHLDSPVDNGPANYVIDFEATDFELTIDPLTVFGPGQYTNSWEASTDPAISGRSGRASHVDAASLSGVRGSVAGILINDTLSDVNALAADFPLEVDNGLPPENIIDIEGPYFDRVFALTSDGFLYPSRQLNPDSFATGQGIRVCAADEAALWVKKGVGGLYIGTTKDIYRLEGDGTELPDGTVNFTKRPLNVDHPPINNGLAREGNLLVYVANDGWRAFSGETTQAIAGATELLYRGYTRHGVSPVNLATGRFRAVLARGLFFAVTPEGSDADSSAILYRHSADGWSRFVYTPRFRSLFCERDGTILAGDDAGGLWQLETDDVLTAVPTVTLWTLCDDAGAPSMRKTLEDLHIYADTGSTTAKLTALLDGQTSVGLDFSVNTAGMRLTLLNASALKDFRQIQLQLTGAFATFRFGGYALSVLPRPIGRLVWDTGPIAVAKGELAWVRRVYVQLKPTGPITVSVTIDGSIRASQTVDVGSGNDVQVPIDFGRGVVGRQVRLKISSATEFQPYWCEVQLRSTGKASQKPVVRVSA